MPLIRATTPNFANLDLSFKLGFTYLRPHPRPRLDLNLRPRLKVQALKPLKAKFRGACLEINTRLTINLSYYLIFTT